MLRLGIALFLVGTAIGIATNSLYGLPLCFIGGVLFGYRGVEYLDGRRSL